MGFWKFLVEHSSFYKGLIKKYDEMSEGRNQVIEDKNKLKEDYTNLTKKNSIQGEIIGRLSNEKLELRNQLILYEGKLEFLESFLLRLDDNRQAMKKELEAYKQKVIPVQEDNFYLQMDLEKRTKELIGIKYDIENVLETCINVRTGYDVIESRVEENHSSNKGLEDWIQFQKRPYEERAEMAEEESKILRSSAYRIVINSIIEHSSRFEKIPFMYYDFIDKELIYRPIVSKIFNVPKKKELTLRGLLMNIRREDLKNDGEDTKILESLRNGFGIKHYKAKTRGDKPQDLRLTTIPFSYDGSAVGVGIFLWDPRFSTKAFKDSRASKEIEDSVRELSEQFDEIRESIRIKQLKKRK